MMRRRIGACLTMIILMATPVRGTELTRAFLDGLKSYKAGDYQNAVVEFSKITATGVQNGKLFYNLANAHLKNGQTGQAILWYERALKLTPADPDLKFNLEYARTLVKDQPENLRSPLLRVLFFWQHLLNANANRNLALVFNALFWLILILQAVLRKKMLRTAGHVMLVLALVFSVTTFYNQHDTGTRKEAVILSDKVSVRSGLADDSTELFVLHAGTKVKIDKENKGFCRIYFSDGKIGWLKKSEIGII